MPSAAPSPNVTRPESIDGCGATDSEPPSRLCVDVVHEAGDWGSQQSVVEAVTQATEALAATYELNHRYRGQDKPTNVLSFPASGSRPEANFLGDVILAGETVVREAEALDLPFKHHLQHLVVHGLLHLLGFDHECDEDAQVMEAIEIRTLARLGIANPYETSASARKTQRAKTP